MQITSKSKIILAGLIWGIIGLLWGACTETPVSNWANILGLLFLVVFAISGYKILFCSGNVVVKHWPLVFSLVIACNLLIYVLAKGGPWQILSLHNDAGHYLTLARAIVAGERHLSPFYDWHWGRVGISVDILTPWIYLFGHDRLKEFIFLIVCITGFAGSVLLYALLSEAAKQDKFKLGLSVFLLSISHFVWMGPTLLDMYFLAPFWLLVALTGIFIQPKKSMTSFFIGVWLVAGWMIAPSTKALAVILTLTYAWKIRKDSARIGWCIAGIVGPALVLVGAMYRVGFLKLFGRESYLISNSDIVWTEKLPVLFKGLADCLFRGLCNQHIYTNGIAIFNFFSVLTVLGILLSVNRAKKAILIFCLFVVFCIMMVTGYADYRFSVVLPLWAIGFSAVIHMSSVWKRYAALVTLGFGVLSANVQILRTEFPRAVSWYCLDLSWMSKLQGIEDLQVFVSSPGLCEFGLYGTSQFSRLGLLTLSSEDSWRNVSHWIEKHGHLKILVPDSVRASFLDISQRKFKVRDEANLSVVSQIDSRLSASVFVLRSKAE